MSDILVKNNILYRVEEDFPEKGVRFIDLTPSLIYTYHRNMILMKMIEHAKELKNVEFVMCPDARGFIWGSILAASLNIPIIPIRKTGKLPNSSVLATKKSTTEYSEISLDLPICEIKNRRVLFVDDVYATGGTYKVCKELAEEQDAEVLGACVVYDVGLEDNNDVWSYQRGEL